MAEDPEMAESSSEGLEAKSGGFRANPSRTFTRNDALSVSRSSPREPYLSFNIGPRPLHRLIIKIWSHDQGWCNPQYEACEPYKNSHTWFALGIVPQGSLEEPYLCEIQRNVRASTATRCHIRDWRLNTPYQGDQMDENEAQGWLESISSGTTVEVGVFPLARYSGWVNHVYRVEVKLFEDTGTTMLPTIGSTPDTTRSKVITTDPSAESTLAITRQLEKAQMAQTPTRDPEVGARLNNLAVSLAETYERTNSMVDLTSAIVITESAIEAMPDNDPRLAAGLSNLGVWLTRRYDRTQSPDDLAKAIELAQEAIKMTPNDNPHLETRLGNLGDWLDRKYKRTQSLDDLSRLIEVREQGAKITPDGHPIRFHILRILAFNLGRRYERTRSIKDLTRAIEMYQKAVETPIDNDLELAKVLVNLGNCLGTSYNETGRIEDLGDAVEAFDRIVKIVPQGHPRLPAHLSDLGSWLFIRFEATSSEDDLERAIEVAQRAIAATPVDDHRTLALYSSNLGVYLEHWSKQKVSMADRDKAIELTERAIAASPKNHQDLASMLDNLGRLLNRRSDQHSLERAIEFSQKAVEATDSHHLNFATYLANLSQTLSDRYEQTGSLDDLTRAIETIQKAVKATPKGHPKLPLYLQNLSCHLADRYDMFRSSDDLTGAIEAAETAIEITPNDHILLPGISNTLGVLLTRRYMRTGEISDLERSIMMAEQAIMKADPISLPSCFSNLTAALLQRYKRTGSMDDVMHAAKEAQKAVDASGNDRLLPTHLMNLGITLLLQYRRTGLMEDLMKAIKTVQESVDAIHHHHVYLAQYLWTLGNMLGYRYAKTGAKADQDDQLSAYLRSWDCTSSRPADRIWSAKRAADIHSLREEWSKACDMSQKAVLLLPKISPRSLKQSDMQEVLSPMFGLAGYAGVLALNAGKPASEVLSILELSRGVIASLLIDTRSDLSDLREIHPSLADRFETLRKELDSPPKSSGSLFMVKRRSLSQNDRTMAEVSMVNRRHQASREFDEVIEQIRVQDGFHAFLQPPPAESLMAAADPGPIVVINIDNTRSDAILVERQTIRQVEISGLTLSEIEAYVERLGVFKHNPWPLLERLWTNVCRPCLDALGFTEPVNDEQWPHVWWVPIGTLSRLPLHAAGIYTPGSKETVLDRVVSSYASSIKALQHGRRLRGGVVDEGLKRNDAILVAMEQTRGQMSLPNAKREIDKVKTLCQLLHLNVTTPPRRKAEILEHLRKCKILHFAGHGESRTDPSQSCILLDDWQTDPLTVADLRESWLQESPAFLAYLSACSTGSIRAERLSDEAIHLVSAFQLAGFRHVVGTLWEVSDPHCVDVAAVLYQTLCEEGMTDEAVSYGLHRAVRKLRDESFRKGSKRDIVLVEEDEGQTPGPSVNTFWIPYIHFGA